LPRLSDSGVAARRKAEKALKHGVQRPLVWMVQVAARRKAEKALKQQCGNCDHPRGCVAARRKAEKALKLGCERCITAAVVSRRGEKPRRH